MFVFAVLGFILFIVIPAVYVYSFFKPSKFGIRTAGTPSGKYSRMNFTGLIALVWFAVLFLGSIFTDPEATTENVAAKNSEPTTVSKQEPKPEQVESNEKVAVATPLKEESVKEAKKEVVATEKEVIAPKK